MKIGKLVPGKRHFECIECENTLEALQEHVCGYIETITLCTDACLVVNEEGAINGMPYNCHMFGLCLYGNILLVGIDGDEFTDIREDFLKYFGG